MFQSKLAKNGQVTLKKEIRELLGIAKGDLVFLQVVKVETPEGVTKYKQGEGLNPLVIAELEKEKEE